MWQLPVPEFIPHPWLRGGHLQTLGGAYLSRRLPYRARQHHVATSDGDTLILHDDCPSQGPARRVVLLLHGLAGCHGSGYMQRVAAKLCRRGIRAFRMDLRGCGAGLAMARHSFHAGRSDDLHLVAGYVQRLCPEAALTLVGFSLGGNIVLKWACEMLGRDVGAVDSLIAVAPPIDLMTCCHHIQRGWNRIYDRVFVRRLLRYVDARRPFVPALAEIAAVPRPRSLYEFDDRFTARLAAFRDATDYYRQCSSLTGLSQIQVPTRILAAADDPLIPVQVLRRAKRSPAVDLQVARSGGHLGFLSASSGRRAEDADWHWMDWRIVEWVQEANQFGR